MKNLSYISLVFASKEGIVINSGIVSKFKPSWRGIGGLIKHAGLPRYIAIYIEV